MNLITVYNLLETKEITLAEAANSLGFTEANLKFRMGHWGHRLPLLLSTLDKIKSDAISRSDAAELLQITARQVNHLMESWRVVRPLKPYLVDRQASKIKWELRKKFAIDYIGEKLTIEKAAEGAGVDPRQMRRWVSSLLEKHFEMPFKDLKQITLKNRRRMADEIETAEGLELAKQRVLETIAKGKKTVADEALDRVMSKRTNQHKVVGDV